MSGEHREETGPTAHGFSGADELLRKLTGPEEDQSGFDERQQATLRESRFFEAYRDDIRQLFTALGREHEWSEDPLAMLDYVRNGWIGGEHGNRAKDQKDQFTREQEAAAMPILERMGLTGETLPADGTEYDDVIIVGGTTPANYRRMKMMVDLIQNHGIRAEKITFFLGQRHREDRDGTDDELLGTEGRFAGGDITENPWVDQILKLDEAIKSEGAGFEIDKFPFETDLGRVATMKAVPGGEGMKPHRIGLEVAGPGEALPDRVKGMPPRLMTDYHFTVPIQVGDGTIEQEIVILNAAAVERIQGDPRHTTASSTGEWIERHDPKQGARVLYITGNPHTVRTAQDTMLMLKDAGREDIHLDIAGTTPPKGMAIQTALGEVGRLIDNDIRRNYPQDASPEQTSES